MALNFHPVAEANFTGQEHGIVAQEYFLDDDVVFDLDPDLDGVAFREWSFVEAVYNDDLRYASHPVEIPSIIY